jgi:hypothetical protein
VKKFAQNVAKYIFAKLLRMYVTFTVAKSSPKMWGNFRNYRKTAQSKQSPIGLKFAQSGHPGNIDPRGQKNGDSAVSEYGSLASSLT